MSVLDALFAALGLLLALIICLAIGSAWLTDRGRWYGDD
jgi:hypothetical protein